MSEFTKFNPHIVLLDISLPFFNAYHWCTEIRKISKVPITKRHKTLTSIKSITDAIETVPPEQNI